MFLVAIIFHVSTHLGWYRGIIENGIGRKSRVAVVLSIVFLLLSVTGGSLLVINESDYSLGLWHYKIGVITSVITVGHVIKRQHALRRALNTKNSKFQYLYLKSSFGEGKFGDISGVYNKKRVKYLIFKYLTRFVPRPGVEPGWMLLHWCLRPARLPIPPSGLIF